MSNAFGYTRFDDEIGDQGTGGVFNNNDRVLDRLCGKISDELTNIKSNVGSLDKLVHLLGSPREPASLRSQIASMQQQTSLLIKSVNDDVREANEKRRGASDRSLQFRLDRLQADFKTLVQTFQKLQSQIKIAPTTASGGSAVVANTRTGGVAYGAVEQEADAGTSTGGSRQISAQLAREDDVVAMQQREVELVRLEQDMVAVHEIFKDLSSMVYEQGQVVDSIEGHVEQASAHVEQGQEELARAVQHKRSYRRNCCILWMVVAVVLTIIIVVLVVQLS